VNFDLFGFRQLCVLNFNFVLSSVKIYNVLHCTVQYYVVLCSVVAFSVFQSTLSAKTTINACVRLLKKIGNAWYMIRHSVCPLVCLFFCPFICLFARLSHRVQMMRKIRIVMFGLRKVHATGNCELREQ